MSRDLPENVQAVADQLELTAGSYLQSTIRDPGHTCDVCGSPVSSSYARCVHCTKHAESGHPLADRVGSLIYASKPDSQSYLLVRNYKTLAAGPSIKLQMAALLALGLKGHTQCLSALVGAGVQGWAVVPSTRGRAVLHDLVQRIARAGAREIHIDFTGSSRSDRALHPEFWKVDTSAEVPDHVLLVDDSWVTGSHAQGVASALKTAGVSQVSIFTVANVLDSNWDANRRFIKSHLAPPSFDKSRCPWTGSDCP